MTDEIQNGITIKDIFFNIKSWMLYLKSKWYIILLAGLIGGAFGFWHAYSKKLMYAASLNFAMEDDKNGGIGGAMSIASQFGIDLGSSSAGVFSGANLLELMKSRTLIERTILSPILINGKKTSLAEFYIDFTGMRKLWEEKPQLKQVNFFPETDRSKFTFQQDSIIAGIYRTILKDNLKVDQQDKKASIISIDVLSENELFSKFLAETLAKEISSYYTDFKTKKSVANVKIIQQQTDSVRNELNAAISGVATFNDNTFNLNPALGIKKVPTSKKQIDIQANTAVLMELIKNLELAKINLRKETPLIQIIDKPILPLNRIKPSSQIWMVIGFIIGITLATFFLLSYNFIITHIQDKGAIIEL